MSFATSAARSSQRGLVDGAGSPISDAELEQATDLIERMVVAYDARLVGQAQLRTSLLVTLLAQGNVLVESVPGLAKTTAAATLAGIVNASFARIQCTPDLLPSDIVGTQVYDPSNGEFDTRLGPIHANFVLLDEINRASAKTQSATLEAMQERQTSIGGVMYPLPRPFMVLATQNPIEEEGTYHLPQAQLDRFLLKDVIDYPTPDDELEVLKRINSGVLGTYAPEPEPVIGLDDLRRLIDLAARVYVDEEIQRYAVALAQATAKRRRRDRTGARQLHRTGLQPSRGDRLAAGVQSTRAVERPDVRRARRRPRPRPPCLPAPCAARFPRDCRRRPRRNDHRRRLRQRPDTVEGHPRCHESCSSPRSGHA